MDGCDEEFFRTELHWIDHVRDQRDADIHLLITQQQTGGGGNEYTMRRHRPGPLGRARRRRAHQHRGRGAARTRCADAGAHVRAVAGALRRGNTGRRQADADAASRGHRRDADHGGGRSAGISGCFASTSTASSTARRTTSSATSTSTLSANRTTDAWKINIDSGFSYSESEYVLSDGTFHTYMRNRRFNTLVVKSLSDHWSAGAMLRASRDTYENKRLDLRIAPGIEYNVFRYAESTNRQLTFQWTAGFRRFRYDELTIYGKLEENRWDQQFQAILSLRQPFGTVRVTGEAAHYLDNRRAAPVCDLCRQRDQVVPRVFVQRQRHLPGDHDQLFLPAAARPTKRSLRASNSCRPRFATFMFLGVTYRFGSINNNVVNQRFGG